MSFENQVLFKTLINPKLIAIFDNDGIGAEARIVQADKLRGDLNKAGIKFAAIDYSPPIKIYIGAVDLREFNKTGIRVPTQFDRR